MAEPTTPEITNKWVRMLLSVTREGGPVTLFFVVILFGLLVYGQHNELARRTKVSEHLADKLFDYQEQQLAWLRERVHCAPAGEGR